MTALPKNIQKFVRRSGLASLSRLPDRVVQAILFMQQTRQTGRGAVIRFAEPADSNTDDPMNEERIAYYTRGAGKGGTTEEIWLHQTYRRTAVAFDLLRGRQVRVLDPNGPSTLEPMTGTRLYFRDLASKTETDKAQRTSQSNLRSLRDAFETASVAHVIGTGPSLDAFEFASLPEKSDGEVRITCNSIVASPSLMANIQPDVICFADPVFHFGPSRYAKQFRADLLKAIDLYEPWLVCSEDSAVHLPPKLADYPRLVGLEQRHARNFNLPTADNRWTRRCGNILTNFQLPLAASLTDEILLYGFDGRDPDDDRFWQHSSLGQYRDDAYADAMKWHPSFFNKRDYALYYLKHMQTLTAQIEWLETQGKQAFACQKSLMPVLNSRSSLSHERSLLREDHGQHALNTLAEH